MRGFAGRRDRYGYRELLVSIYQLRRLRGQPWIHE